MPEIPDELGTDDHTTDPECPEKWELCADFEAAGKLERYVRQSQAWIRQAVILCAQPTEEGTDHETNDPD